MKPFPELFELIGLFECEPAVFDEETPLYYNTLKFTLRREHDNVECEIEPSYNTLKLKWFQGDRELAYLDVQGVKGLEIDRRSGKEVLCVLFEKESYLETLFVQLKPSIRIKWGTRDYWRD